jgi:hypothetical protein
LSQPEDSIEKVCALRIAYEFPDSQFVLFTESPELFPSILRISNLELLGRFLYRIFQTETGAGIVLGKVELLRANASDPFVLMVFIQLGRFFPRKIVALDWLITVLHSLLAQRKCLEIVLRVLGSLSLLSEFEEQTVIHSDLVDLVLAAECTRLETPLLMAIMYNCPSKTYAKAYQPLLFLSERSGQAFAVLSRLSLPASTSRTAIRILETIELYLRRGDDVYGVWASCEFLKRMPVTEGYFVLVSSRSIDRLLNEALATETNPALVEKLIEAITTLGFRPTNKTRNIILGKGAGDSGAGLGLLEEAV